MAVDLDKRHRNEKRYRDSAKGRASKKRYRTTYAEKIAFSKRAAREEAAEVRRALIAAEKSKPCADCGGSFPVVAMDFDHVRGEKIAAVSELVGELAPLEIIREEISKCEVICANCHRVRTDKRRKDAHRKGVADRDAPT